MQITARNCFVIIVWMELGRRKRYYYRWIEYLQDAITFKLPKCHYSLEKAQIWHIRQDNSIVWGRENHGATF